MLFSDMEGSTSLLARLGDRYAVALDVQRSVLRSAWRRWGGVEMGTEGDSFFVVFATALDGVSAALQAQRDLSMKHWPGGERVAVRMGLHTGEPVAHDGGYVGVDVHRAARVSAAAHGGQVVVTAATGQLVAESLPADATLVDLGWHRLRDFAESVHLYQLNSVGLPDTFPPLRTLGTSSSLPVETTPLVGRHGELRELQALLLRPGVRLASLTGPGGSGKTRLAIALAAAQAHAYPDGVFFVALAGVAGGEDMWAAMFDVLGVTGAEASRGHLLAQLAHRRALLVLDNLEQIGQAGEVVGEVLESAPRLVVVATSRRPLHVRGEHEYPVPPLQLPEGDHLAEAEDSGAVQLFCQHAQMVRAGFSLTVENVGDVVAVCRRLDGLPLAVELAAARSKLLSPSGLLKRLSSVVDLGDNAVGRPIRQRTLRDTIAWSYDLLPLDLRAVFRRLGVFAGGADLDAVAAVAMVDIDRDPFDAAVALVDVSLLQVAEDMGGEPRFAPLQTVADFALDRLTVEGDLVDARSRHAEHYLGVAEALAPDLSTDRGLAARQRLQTESDNFRAALTWALQPGADQPPTPQRARLGLQLCAALAEFWIGHAPADETRRWYERALELDSGAESRERAHVLVVLVEVSGLADDDPRHVEQLEQARDISRRLNDPAGECEALLGLAAVQLVAGRLSLAGKLAEQSESTARRAGDRMRLGIALHRRGWVEDVRGNWARALDLLAKSQDVARERGDEIALAYLELHVAPCLANVGRGREALDRLRRCSADVLRISHQHLTASLLAAYAVVYAALGDAQAAATLLGAHWAQLTKTGRQVVPEFEEPWLQREGLASVRDTLGTQRWQNAIQAGGAYTLQEALAYAHLDPNR
jgi:predicted ATPase/class 3 adenylate cyclase